MIFSSIKTGFARMLTNKRMVGTYFVANFIFGVILMLPFRAVIKNFAGNSLMGTSLAGHLNMDFVFDLLAHKRDLFSVMGTMILVVPLVYWFVNIFLSGGAFVVFASEGKYDKQQFWGGASAYFGRFLRLGVYSLLFFALFFAVQFLETLVMKIFFHSDAPQNISYWGGWIKFALRTLGILLYGVVFDYARIMIVLKDEREIFKTLWRGVKFTFRNFGRVFSLAFILFIIGAVVLVIYNPIANVLAVPNALVVFALFLLQQGYMLFRMGLRLTLFASEVTLLGKLEAKGMEEVQTSEGDFGLAGAPA